MKDNRYRGWRFLLPYVDVGEGEAGLSLSPQGGVAGVSGAAAVRQAILLLLSTTPGERVMRPAYGCELHQLLFAPNDDTTAGLAMHYVRRALERWEPRVEILGLDARRSEAPGRLDVELDYRVRATRERASLTLAVDLETEWT